MPLGFGAGVGPRHNPIGGSFDDREVETLALSVTGACDRQALQAIVPEGITVVADLVVAEVVRLRNIPWLAGRGYNIVDVSIPAQATGEHETVEGNYTCVLWESRPEPILTGREDLGFAKIFAEISDLEEPSDGMSSAFASWDGFCFFSIGATGLAATSRESDTPPATSSARLHWKYIPATGEWGEADVSYPVVTPAGDPPRRLVRHFSGSGEFAFKRASFVQVPTMFHIINALADLPISGFSGATMSLSLGAKELSDQRRVH